MPTNTIVLCGGGTAGHIMPHVALLDGLRENFKKIVYIGGKNSLEEQIANSNNLQFYGIDCVKLKRSLTPQNLLIPFKLMRSVQQAQSILRAQKPDIVFSKGGYVSLPVVMAAHRCGIKVVAHESDFTPGLANRIGSRYASCVCTSFEPCAKLFKKKGIYTKTPIRKSLFSCNKQDFLTKNKLNPIKKTVLVMGGSSGARAVNRVLEQCLPSLAARYNVIHLTGKGNKNNYYHRDYLQLEFTEDVSGCFAAADFAVCRAGANTVFEMLALSKPMLLVPLPKGASRGDQLQNADYLKQNGLASVLPQSELTPQRLFSDIVKLSYDAPALKQAISRHNFDGGTQAVLDIILKYAQKSEYLQ